MRTTIRLDDDLLVEAKQRAARSGLTLTAVIEQALRENRRDQWPLIVVHFDFKDLQAPLLRAVWQVLGEYQGWITTAAKTGDASVLSPFDVKPLLVLTEEADEQERKRKIAEWESVKQRLAIPQPPVPEATCSVRLSERDEAEVMAAAEKPPAPNEAALQAAKRFIQRHG